MNTFLRISLPVLCLGWLLPNGVYAQPIRQLPGTRPFLAGMLPQQAAAPNPRVRPAASQVGVESTDFYGKRGYPKQLGDFYESATGASGSASAAGSMGGNSGNSGVQSAGSSGFQGNTGNQIGQNGGGTVLGGLFGGGAGGGGGVGGGTPFSRTGGVTGGGFTGITPKGFGFGGTP